MALISSVNVHRGWTTPWVGFDKWSRGAKLQCDGIQHRWIGIYTIDKTRGSNRSTLKPVFSVHLARRRAAAAVSLWMDIPRIIRQGREKGTQWDKWKDLSEIVIDSFNRPRNDFPRGQAQRVRVIRLVRPPQSVTLAACELLHTHTHTV